MLSVCLATHNGEKYIREQLVSILAQIDCQDEVVISDDGSTDGTLQIIKSFDDSRIKVLSFDPMAVTTTFPLDKPTHNFENALLNAQGDIIFLSDQDDVWVEGKVSAMIHALENADLAVHDCTVTDEQLNPIADSYFGLVRVHQGVFLNIIRATYLGCCMAMKREVVKAALPFPQTKVGHDLWLGLVADMKFKTVLVNRSYLLYRKHSKSLTTSGQDSKYSLWFKLDYRLVIIKNVIKKKFGL